jgi:hypothetical protein
MRAASPLLAPEADGAAHDVLECDVLLLPLSRGPKESLKSISANNYPREEFLSYAAALGFRAKYFPPETDYGLRRPIQLSDRRNKLRALTEFHFLSSMAIRRSVVRRVINQGAQADIGL